MAATNEPLSQLVAHLSLSWLGYRVAELRAAAEAAGVELSVEAAAEAALEARADAVLLRIGVPDEESVRRLANRSVLAKGFVDVWACGATWEELESQLLAYPRDRAAPFLADGTTFRVIISSFGKKHTDAERMAIIRSLEPLLPWRGKVSLKQAQHTFVVLVDNGGAAASDNSFDAGPCAAGAADALGCTSAALMGDRTRFYFGRLLAEGRRDLVGKLDLKKRNYIGTTSLDAELSLLMANLARVRAHDLVYDPYCGTAGTLVAAGAFGARVLGCDLHLPAIKGDLRTRSGPSKLKQAKVQGIPQTFAAYGLPLPVDRLHGDSGAALAFLRSPPASARGGGGLFEAIITDPPYGIRERSMVRSTYRGAQTRGWPHAQGAPLAAPRALLATRAPRYRALCSDSSGI